MALGTWALVGITIKIARKQLKVKEKEMEHPQIVEFLGAICFVEGKLKEEISALEARKFYWSHKRMKSRNFNRLNIGFSSIYYYKFPRVHVGIIQHDFNVSSLDEKLKELDEKIYTPDFERECFELVKGFNEESSESSRREIENVDDFVSGLIDKFKSYDKILNELAEYLMKEYEITIEELRASYKNFERTYEPLIVL